MKISIENKNEKITEFRIRHKGVNMNFVWTCKNLSEPFSFTEVLPTNVCEIYINDSLELKNFLYVLERANSEICGMIGNFE